MTEKLAGIDGCKAGWFVVTADKKLGNVHCFVAANIFDAAEKLCSDSTIGIDIPIGTPDSGPRACDFLARKRLSPLRSSSVFPAPIRPILGLRDYAHACNKRASIDGKRMSRQAFNILPKIDEVDRFARSEHRLARRLYEVHPELAFSVLNNDRPMNNAKRKPAGFDERYELICRKFSGSTIDAALQQYPRSMVAKDDVLDAFVVLHSAKRIVEEKAERVPLEGAEDSEGLDMTIWF